MEALVRETGDERAEEDRKFSAVVLYHYPCPDGAFAALAAHLYHSALRCSPPLFLPNTVYSPLRVEELVTEGVDVFYLLDFVGPKDFAVELSHKARWVVVLDHHKTALEMLPDGGDCPPNLEIVLDMKRSGATIAYDYFTEKLQEATNEAASVNEQAEAVQGHQSLFKVGGHKAKGLVTDQKDIERVETLFRYIEDADLWRWALPDSKAFSSGLIDTHIEFSTAVNPSVFNELLALDPAAVIEIGRSSLSKQQTLIDQALQSSFQVQLGQGKFGQCLGVLADTTIELRSELGNQLAAKSLSVGLRPIGAVVYVEPALNDASQYKISLRSIGPEDDTTQISEAYGGGGHCNASSFLISKKEFEQWRT
ncbi:unnamed protein product [Sphagnum balticum]